MNDNESANNKAESAKKDVESEYEPVTLSFDQSRRMLITQMTARMLGQAASAGVFSPKSAPTADEIVKVANWVYGEDEGENILPSFDDAKEQQASWYQFIEKMSGNSLLLNVPNGTDIAEFGASEPDDEKTIASEVTHPNFPAGQVRVGMLTKKARVVGIDSGQDDIVITWSNRRDAKRATATYGLDEELDAGIVCPSCTIAAREFGTNQEMNEVLDVVEKANKQD
jgi:hypothetical protein